MFKYMFGKSLSNGFGSSSTADEIGLKYESEVKGKVVIVTGCNVGIGKQTVKSLVANGAKVVMACRNLEKCNVAIEEINVLLKSKNKHSSTDSTAVVGSMIPLTCDLGSFESIRKFVTDFHALKLPLNVLINNAGVMACDFTTTKDGHEMQFGTNHLGHFLLTELLLPDLKKSSSKTSLSRIVILASSAHMSAYKEGIRFDQLQDENGYTKWSAYGQSKLANVLHARELNERFTKNKVDNIVVNALHPGVIATSLWRHMSIIGPLVKILGAPFTKNEQQGAATTMYLACSTAPDATKGGGYFVDCNNADDIATEHSKDQKLWQKLRDTSFKLTGTSK